MHVENTDLVAHAIAEDALMIHKVDRICQHCHCIGGCGGECFVDVEAVPDSLTVAGLGRQGGPALLAVGEDPLQ